MIPFDLLGRKRAVVAGDASIDELLNKESTPNDVKNQTGSASKSWFVLKKQIPSAQLREVRAALRRDSARHFDIIYNSTIKSIGNELQFSSTRYIAMAFLGLYSDAVYTLWDPVKSILDSPLIKKMVEQELGAGMTIMDYLKHDSEVNASDRAKVRKTMDKALEAIKRLDKLVEAIADYCVSNKKSPDKVLQSKKQMLGPLTYAYGDLENFEKIQNDGVQNLTQYVDKLDVLKNMPFDIIIPVLIKAKVTPNIELSQAGVDRSVIGDIARDYVTDFAKFGRAFISEMEKYHTKELMQYKAIEQKK